MRIQISDHFTVGKLLRFVFPSIIMMIFTSIYGVVDGFFFSNYVGKTPFAAVNLIMPLLMAVGAIGFMLGSGGSALVAKTCGEGDAKRANRYFSMVIYAAVIIGPYSLAGRLYDMSEIMMLIYINPDAANTLLRKCSDFITRYCMALKATGVNGVVMAEPAAGLLSNEDCLQYSSLFVKEIIEKVQDDHFAVVLHNCGNTGNCTQAMVYTGAAVYHFGNKIKMEEALKEVPTDALAMGNLDPVSLFKMAGPETMKEATLQLLEATRAYPNFVLSSGCDIPPHTSSINIDAFYTALEEFNKTQV